MSERAGQAADWTRETAQDASAWAGRTAATAGSLWDTASNTQLSVGRNGLSGSMRMRDLAKVLPPEAAGALTADERGLDDRVNAQYQYGSDSVTLTAPRMSLAALNIAGFRCGSARATDVTVVVSNPGGKIPFVQDGWQTSGNLRLAVTVGFATGENVSYGLTSPMAHADRVDLYGISVTGAAPTARVTGVGSGNMQGTFAVQRAVVAGLSVDGASAAQVDVSDARAGWQEDTGRVQGSAGVVNATGITAGGATATTARLSGVQADMTGTNGSASARGLSATGITAGQGQVGAVQAGGLSAGWDTSRRTAQAGVDTLSATDLSQGGTRLASVNAQVLSAQTATTAGGQTVSGGLTSATARGLTSGDLSLREASVAGVTANANTTTGVASGSVRTASGQGLTSGALSADTLTGSGLTANRGVDGALGMRAASLSGGSLQAGGVNAATASASGVRLDREVSGRNVVGANTLGLDGVTSQYGNATTVAARGLSVDTRPGALGVSADAIRANGLTSAQGSATALSADAVRVATAQTNGATTYDASVGALGLDGINASGLTADQIRARDLSARGTGGQVDATLGGAQAQNLAYGGVGSANAVDLEGGRFTRGTDGAYGASLASGQVNGLRAGDLTAQQVTAQQFGVNGQGDRVNATLGGAQGTALGYGEVAQAGSASLANGQLTRGPDGTRVGLGQGNVSNAQVNAGGVNATATSAAVQGLDVSGNGSSIGLERGRVDGLAGTWTRPAGGAPAPALNVPHVDLAQANVDATVSMNPGTIRLGAGSGTLARDAAGLVDDANIRASAPLRPADLGMVEIENNTRANARVAVQDGRLVPGQTGVQMSRPLDGPLWTTVNGIELESARTRTTDARGRSRRTNDPNRGEVRADIGGFIDPHISSEVMQAMGGRGDTVPLGVSELAGLATRQMPATQSDGQQVTLAREQAGDNEVRVQSDARGAVATFVRLLVGSMQVRMGTTTVETGRSAASGARIEARGAPTQPEQLSGTIGSLEVERLRANR